MRVRISLPNFARSSTKVVNFVRGNSFPLIDNRFHSTHIVKPAHNHMDMIWHNRITMKGVVRTIIMLENFSHSIGNIGLPQ